MRSLLSIAAIAAFCVPVANAAAAQSEAKQIVGAWKLEFTAPDGEERTPTVLVGRQHQELVAWYFEKDKPESFKKVQLKDDTLLLTFRPKERREIEVTFRASLEKENVCTGEAEYESDDGDFGSWTFKGQRVSESDFDDSEKWQLRFVTPDDQQHDATVTVLAKKDQLYAWYTSKEFDLPALKLTKDGSNVVMLITTKTKDGARVDVTFRGAMDGGRITGEADYDLEGDTGRFPFEAERKS